VISSTFDEPASRHVQVAEMVIGSQAPSGAQKGRRHSARFHHSRLRGAYNTVVPPSGQSPVGASTQRPAASQAVLRRGAQNIEEGGSLTIVASALVDTGTAWDDVILKNSKARGNMEIHLDRKLMDKLFPRHRYFEIRHPQRRALLPREELNRVWCFASLNPLSPVESMELLIDKLSKTRSNSEFSAR